MEASAYSFDVNDVLKRSRRFETARLGGRLRWLLLRRATETRTVPLFGRINALRFKAERFARLEVKTVSDASCRWLPVGPRNVNGRIRALAIHPANAAILYAGAADGGVWKTTDAGQSWKPLTDDQDSLSIGALAIDPTTPDTVYAGTGEPLRDADVGAYGWAYPGIGVLKTTDGGATWTVLGTVQNQFIYRIAVDPHDSTNLLCAGFAIDGTGGLCRWDTAANQWTVVAQGTFTDVLFDPVNVGRAYAGKYDGGVLKSMNNGVTWAALAGVPAAGGRVSISLARQQPDILYARLESSGLVYRTTNAGGTWAALPDPGADVGPNAAPANQRYWCSYVAADPMDPTGDTVYVGGIDLVRRERDAGGTLSWNRISPTYTPPAPTRATHADHHDIAFVPGDSTRFYIATDGGVFSGQNNPVSGAEPPVQWRKVSTGLAVTQFYDLATSAASPSMFGGGCQDNGTLVSTGGASWRHVYGGDGSYLAFHPTDPWTIWAVRWDGGAIIQRSTDGGATFKDAQGTAGHRVSGGGESPVVPLAIVPTAPATLFAGTQRIWRTTNGDASAASVAWNAQSADIGTVTEITVASAQEIYAGTMDGLLYFSADGGTTFAAAAAAPWPRRWLSGITIRPGTPPTMFITLAGFNPASGASDHVWKGAFNPAAGPNGTWQTPMTSISANLPNAPVGALVVDPTTPTTLYVATDVGVFRSIDDGTSWSRFDDGMPNAPVVDLALHPTLPILRAATHGRGMFQRRLASPCADVDIYMRDTVIDTGEVEPTTTGPDPTMLGQIVHHWHGADIKVDAPPFQPVDALVDGVEFDNPTHRPLPFGYPIETVLGLTHKNPVRAKLNRIYVQAHNRGPRTATNVDVRLLWADAGAALPPLPGDFWTHFVTDAYDQTVWHLIGKQQIATLESGTPRVVRFDWTPPANTSDHVCLLALLDSPDDPLLPQAQLNVDVLTRSNKRVGQKNVHPVTVVDMPMAQAGWGVIRFHNAFRTGNRFTIRVQGATTGHWTVSLVVPPLSLAAPLSDSLGGFRVRAFSREQLDAWVTEAEASGAVSPAVKALRPTFADPVILEVETLRVGAELRGVLIAPDRALPALVIASQPPSAPVVPLRIDVTQLLDAQLLGGSTFVIA